MILIVIALILIYLAYNQLDINDEDNQLTLNKTNEPFISRGRRHRYRPTRLSHIALLPGVAPIEYPWDRDQQGVFKYDYFQKKDCSNNIWFPPYYPWYPTFNKTPIAS